MKTQHQLRYIRHSQTLEMADKLRAYYNGKGLSFDYLSTVTGISVSTLQRWVNHPEQYRTMNADTYFKLNRFFKERGY